MAVIPMKALLEAGVQFGHQTNRWNPKMAPYIFTSRGGTHIIDLEKTSECIDQAYEVFNEIGKDGGKVLFVGTKKQAQEVIKEEAVRCGHYYVNVRWLGGTLTNFKTIRKSVKKLQDYEKMEEDGTFKELPKKEVNEIKSKMQRLQKFFGGIYEMTTLPQAIFVVDPHEERTAVLEAKRLHIPVFGIVDTNCDPDDVDYVIPANDDAIRSLKLIIAKMADALIEGAGGVVETPAEEVILNETPAEEVVVEMVQTKVQDEPVEEVQEELEAQDAQEAPEEAPQEEAPVNLSKLKVAELKELAEKAGIEGFKDMKKAELIEALSK